MTNSSKAEAVTSCLKSFENKGPSYYFVIASLIAPTGIESTAPTTEPFPRKSPTNKGLTAMLWNK